VRNFSPELDASLRVIDAQIVFSYLCDFTTSSGANPLTIGSHGVSRQ
jgi:hypothetical protein